MTTLKPGEVLTLPVKRKIETGYVLGEGEDDILLHENETKAPLKEGDNIEVYLYHDKQGQLISTTILPHVRYDVFDWAEVTDVKDGLGVFVDIGTTKHVLVSSDDLPEHTQVWPIVGDLLYVTLKQDKKGRLLADPVKEADFEGNWDVAPKELYNKDIGGRVFRSGKEGAVLLTEAGYRGFIHYSERKQEPRIGEWVDGRVIKVKDDGSLNISLLPRKQEAQTIDADALYQYMVDNNHEIPFDNTADPERIKDTFDISKGAFKRAIGKLLKEGYIKQENGKTYLIKEKTEDTE